MSNVQVAEILDVSTQDQVEKLFQFLICTMQKCEMDDFHIEKNSDYSSNSLKGQQNFLYLTMLVGIYQVLLEYNFLQNCHIKEASQTQINLVGCWKNVYEVMKAQKNRHFTGKIKWQLSCSSFLYISTMVDQIFYETPSELDDAFEYLKQNDEFLTYCWTSTRAAVSYLRDHGYYPGVGSLDPVLLFDQVCKVARASMHYFMSEKNNRDICHISCIAIECFDLSLQYVHQWRRERLDNFFSQCNVDKECPISSCSQQKANAKSLIDRLISSLQRIIIGFVQEHGDAGNRSNLTVCQRKLLSASGSVIDTIIRTIINSDYDHEEILSKTFEWWKKVCVIRIGDSTSSKHFLSSLLDTASSAHSSLTSYENVLRDLCADFRNQKSTSDDGSEPKTTYKIISPENVEQLAPTLTKHLDAYYSGMEWLMQQMKGQVSKFVDTNKNADDVFYDQREKVKQREGVICTNVLKVSRGLLELSQTTPSESVFTDSIIKCFTNSFVFYTALSKYVRLF